MNSGHTPLAAELVKYDAMVRSIAECKKVDEVKDIRDKALALEAYAKQALNYEAERQCAEIRVRAERQCGIMLAQMEKAKGGAQPGVGRAGKNALANDEGIDKSPTLADMNISYDQSSKWQQLAKVPEEEFERIVAMPGAKPSANTFIKKKEEPLRMDDDALWLWGELRRCRERNTFERDLNELVGHWTQAMSDDAESMIPKLQKWVNSYEASNNA